MPIARTGMRQQIEGKLRGAKPTRAMLAYKKQQRFKKKTTRL